ncbi:PREDICTED: uncharacterized protein LOC105152469 [Acromyrmex echinatior]|uniref:uncharacterized protein LOC105152469 n=1 Tax=Acromyrmex echinatior TaxID=103372 RepID=UPI00058107A8|nr:PREDICTED: uncharacterized protein LOC105152469 [Acromyrmex echinatior]
MQGEGGYIREYTKSPRSAWFGWLFTMTTTTTTTTTMTRRARTRRAEAPLRLCFDSQVPTTGPTNGCPDLAGYHDEAGPTRRERPWRVCTRQGGSDSTNRHEGTASTARSVSERGPTGPNLTGGTPMLPSC